MEALGTLSRMQANRVRPHAGGIEVGGPEGDAGNAESALESLQGVNAKWAATRLVNLPKSTSRVSAVGSDWGPFRRRVGPCEVEAWIKAIHRRLQEEFHATESHEAGCAVTV